MSDESRPDEQPSPETQTPETQTPETQTPETPASRPSRFPPAARWTLVFIIVMLALVVAIWPRGGDDTPPATPTAAPSGPRIEDAQVGDAELGAARRDAALPNCPQTGQPASRDSVLAGIVEQCLATGAPYDIGAGTAGRPLVINMWATWCNPCKTELPMFDEFARRATGKVSVIAVHAKEGGANPYFPLKLLGEIGVHLPATLDTKGRIAAALEAPRVFPSTIMVRPDGSVAKILPQVFHSADDIADSVAEHLGVRV